MEEQVTVFTFSLWSVAAHTVLEQGFAILTQKEPFESGFHKKKNLLGAVNTF